MEEPADKLASSKPLHFSAAFCFFSSLFCLTVLYVSATTLNKSGMLQTYVCQLFEVRQHELANLSLPCEGRLRTNNIITNVQCFLKFYEI